MAEKITSMNIPTIGKVEFVEDNDFSKMIKELDELIAAAEYDTYFWGIDGGDDCE